MNRVATLPLAPLSLLYGAAIKARASAYRTGILKARGVAAPVISVGNITVGGTGKTPLVQWFARELAESGRRVCILTRGYGRENPSQRVVVSDGQRIANDVARSGDEAMMLAESLRGKAAVVCEADRVSAAEFAIENLKSDVLILDDGFQNQRIARDLNIVTIDAMNPFGNGWLLPAGILREPISSLKRADCVMLTRVSGEIDAELIKRIRKVTNAPVFESRTVIKEIRRLDSDETSNNSEARNQPLAAFCAIGNPRAFFDQLRGAGLDLQHQVAFRDHHKYSQSDIDCVTQNAKANGAQAVITTAKDEVKLRSMQFDLPCYVATIEVDISEPAILRGLIEKTVAKHAR